MYLFAMPTVRMAVIVAVIIWFAFGKQPRHFIHFIMVIVVVIVVAVWVRMTTMLALSLRIRMFATVAVSMSPSTMWVGMSVWNSRSRKGKCSDSVDCETSSSYRNKRPAGIKVLMITDKELFSDHWFPLRVVTRWINETRDSLQDYV